MFQHSQDQFSLLEDAGFYSCAAVSTSGSILARAELKVIGSPQDRSPPVIHLGPTNQTLGVGEAAEMPCEPSSERSGGRLVVVWLKDGVPIESSQTKRSRVGKDNSLTIKGKKNLIFFALCWNRFELDQR